MVGDIKNLNGVKLLTLDEIDGNPFVLAIDLDIRTEFSYSSNNYAESLLRKKTEEWLLNTNFKAIKRTINLQTMDGYNGYGKLDVLAAPLTFDEYRKYADIIIPNIKNCFWLSTGWGRPNKADWSSNSVCLVTSTGNAAHGYCTTTDGHLAPAFILDKSSLKEYTNDLSKFSMDELLTEIIHRSGVSIKI